MHTLPALLTASLLTCSLALPVVAHAESAMKACSQKYQAAKTAGTLNGATWKSFRASQCGSTTAATPAASAAASPATAPATTATKPAAVAAATPAAPMAKTAPVASGPATFPSQVDAKYAKLTPGKARMQTCLDQYHTNKTNGGNGGLKWIQSGGGYYSEYTKKLKGA